MRPLTDFLVGVLAEINTILHITHVTNGNLIHVIRSTEFNDLTTGFVQDVSLLAVHLGAGSRLTLH